jgi:hypothetical protein
MRVFLTILFSAIAGYSVYPAHADPLRWCAVIGDSSICYFITLDQCQATVFGLNGYCAPNNLYNGRRETTPGSFVRSRRLP